MDLNLIDTSARSNAEDIDRENRNVSDLFRSVLASGSPLPLEMLRAAQGAMASAMATTDGVEFEIETSNGPLTLRRLNSPGSPTGVFLHIHGGGFMLGSAKQGDLLNTMLRDQLGVTTISVEYRLAPEHPHPAAVDNCLAAALWVLEHSADLGSDRLLIGGESAGAYLAAMTMLRLKASGHRLPLGASLVSGVYDLSGTPSQTGVGAGPDGLTPDFMAMSRDALTPGMTIEQRRDPSVSPLFADLDGLCPALFTVGQTDHLVDDSLFMASRWSLAGNRTELVVLPEAGHMAAALPSVHRTWVPQLVDFLAEALTPDSGS